MLDKHFITLLKRPLDFSSSKLSSLGIKADHITVFGFVVGMLAVPALWFQLYYVALVFIVANRVCDGLDGAVARQQGTTDLGGYLDITMDFIFYSSIVFGFALSNPTENALPAAFLMLSFMGTGSSFLAFAIMAEKRHIINLEYGKKSLFYLGGLTEGAETIFFLISMCLFPDYFAVAAYVFGCLCFITTGTRIYSSYLVLK